MIGAQKPPKDPELDAAVLRVPYWRTLGLTAAALMLGLPVVWYLATQDRGGNLPPDDAWLDGSSWRIVEVERRPLAREGVLHFRNGRVVVEAQGCAPREVAYKLTRTGIELSQIGDAARIPPCEHSAMTETWVRLPAVKGLTRYATGLALTDATGRALIRLRR